VVVGVQEYPHFGTSLQLKWPSRDAMAMAQWLREVASVERVWLRTSADPQARPRKFPIDIDLGEARKDLLDRLSDTFDPDEARELHADSVLLIYFSGHGVGAIDGDVSMLAEDVMEGHLACNLGARSYLEFLKTHGPFARVVIFADCCRSLRPGVRGLAPIIDPGVSHYLGELACAVFATSHGSDASEPQANGERERHGYFTRALLEGLWGAAGDPFTGEVTLGSLYGWLTRRLPQLTRDKQVPSRWGDDALDTLEICRVAPTEVGTLAEHPDAFGQFMDAMQDFLGGVTPDGGVQSVVEDARRAALLSWRAQRDDDVDNPFRAVQGGAFSPAVVTLKIRFPDGFDQAVSIWGGAPWREHGSHDASLGLWELTLPQGVYECRGAGGDRSAFLGDGVIEAVEGGVVDVQL